MGWWLGLSGLRNKLRLNEKGLLRDKLFETARSYLSDFQSKIKETKVQQRRENTKWIPPGVGMYKANYDGAVFAESEKAGIGVIVRDGKGDVIVALAEKIPYPGSVEVLEALAARRAAKFVVELGLSVAEFEGASEVVWKALKATDGAHSAMGVIIKDTMSIVGLLRTFSFSPTRWQVIVHSMLQLREQLFFFSLLVWMEHVPNKH